MNLNRDKNRIDWVDVLKGIAIIFVMLAHYDSAALGRTYFFAHMFSVPLFFFVSGMMSFGAKKLTVVGYAKKQAVRLLVPYFIFAAVNTVFFYLFNRGIGIKGMADMLVTFALGKRNTLAVAPMWFLPCLFAVCLIYKIIADSLKKHRFIVPLCLLISFMAKYFIEEPIMVWSINHGLKYLCYYAIGAAVFPALKELDLKQLKALPLWAKASVAVCLGAEIWYICRLFIGKPVITAVSLAPVCILTFVNAMVIIDFMVLISLLLKAFVPLQLMGRDTLGFCCCESISRALLNTAMAVTGIGFAADSPLKVIVYNFIAMAISYFAIIIPVGHFFPFALGKKRADKK